MTVDTLATVGGAIAVTVAVALLVRQELVREQTPGATRVRSTATAVAVVVALAVLGLRLAVLVA